MKIAKSIPEHSAPIEQSEFDNLLKGREVDTSEYDNGVDDLEILFEPVPLDDVSTTDSGRCHTIMPPSHGPMCSRTRAM